MQLKHNPSMNKFWPGKFQFLASSRQFCQHIKLHPISEQISLIYASEFLLLWCILHCIPFILSPHFSWDQQFSIHWINSWVLFCQTFLISFLILFLSFFHFYFSPFFSSAHSSHNSRHSELFTKYVNDYSRELCLRPIYLFTVFKFYIDL